MTTRLRLIKGQHKDEKAAPTDPVDPKVVYSWTTAGGRRFAILAVGPPVIVNQALPPVRYTVLAEWEEGHWDMRDAVAGVLVDQLMALAKASLRSALTTRLTESGEVEWTSDEDDGTEDGTERVRRSLMRRVIDERDKEALSEEEEAERVRGFLQHWSDEEIE